MCDSVSVIGCVLQGGGACWPSRPWGRPCIAWSCSGRAFTEGCLSRRAAVTTRAALTPQKSLQDPPCALSLLNGHQGHRFPHDRSERDQLVLFTNQMSAYNKPLIIILFSQLPACSTAVALRVWPQSWPNSCWLTWHVSVYSDHVRWSCSSAARCRSLS